MPDLGGQRDRLARAALELKQMRARLEGFQEPIAVIGLGCRFPGGVRDAQSYWQLLQTGQDAIAVVPADRWDADAYYAADPDAPGKIVTRYGGFLDQVDQFDPALFGIAPREAASLDPQHRLLLETAWQALETAGLAADRLRGSRTGVFVGISSNEYAQLLMGAGPERIDPYMGSGNAHSVAAGRLSYVFGFEGPSLAVDTACSSSLVTVHLACQSLRLGECQLALAGGVNVLLTPTLSINHSRARMLAPDGRCKAFDARANGFVRSEGCGLLVLKRLSRAQEDGDPIMAVIQGSAVNQDGHTSGLTVPNGRAQQAVIRQALAQAGIAPSKVAYVEAHGTGTALGDPIELQALGAVFGEQRPAQRPLLVGSVKTNIGHAEAAAGIAGLIKVVLALRHSTIPASLHCRQPNPQVAWDKLPIRVVTEPMPWQGGPELRIAGVSSFGFGGTNAHVVVAEPPRSVRQTVGPADSPALQRPLHLLALSAQSPAALRELAQQYARHLEAPAAPDLGDLCYSANTGRSALRHRLCAIADSASAMQAKLASFATGGATAGLVEGSATPGRRPIIAFLFTGQGSQYAGMARVLFDTQPGFRRDLLRCAELLRPHLDRPLLDLLYAEDRDGVLDSTCYTQPALFALEYCLGRLWQSWGVVPDLMMGHSLGEYAAACLAGVFSLEDGIRLVAVRGRLMQAQPGDGAMAAVFATEADVRSSLAAVAKDVSVAAINGPEHVVISGTSASVAALLEHFRARGIQAQGLKVSQAFHSSLIEPTLAAFERVAREISYAPPRLALISNLTGGLVGSELTQPDYWCRHARQPVRFLEGMRALVEQGADVFLEIGPHPVLVGMGRACVASADVAWLASLRRGREDWSVLLEALAGLAVRGVAVDWQAFDASYQRRRVCAPTYPFQRQRYWAVAAAGADRVHSSAGREPGLHLLLGRRWRRARQPEEILFQSELTRASPAFLDHHLVFGVSLMPASGYIEMAMAAGAAALAAGPMSLENLVFHRPLVLTELQALRVETALRPQPSGAYEFEVHSQPAREDAAAAWTLHASGMLRLELDASAAPHKDLAALRARLVEPIAIDRFYSGYALHGVEYGPSLQAVTALWHGTEEALGRICLPQQAGHEAGYWMHPTWLDACAQVLGAATRESDTTSLQAGIHQVRIYRRPTGPCWAHALLRAGAPGEPRLADLCLLDDGGQVLAELIGLTIRTVRADLLQPNEPATTTSLYELRWLPQPPRQVDAVLPAPATIVARAAPQLEAAMADVRLLDYAAALRALDARAGGYVAAAFLRLGWPYRPGDHMTTTALSLALGIDQRHCRLIDRLMAILAEQGSVRPVPSGWEVTADLLPPEASHPSLGDAAPGGNAPDELALLDHCGSRLADVLLGRSDPLELLFFGGSDGPAARVYGHSPGAAVMHGLTSAALEVVREAWPKGRPLRVLEVGAGTGGATAHLLPSLPKQTEFVYTDISRGFLVAAKHRFADYAFVDYKVLDIEQAPERQGFAGRTFDVVIAFNVLHATRALAETVAHVHQLLAPGGLLLLLENTAPAAWVDLVWGLTPGWWRFSDHDLRPSYPLLSVAQWQGLLTANGFTEVESLAADPQRNEILARQALLVARKAMPPRQPGTWLILADAGGVGDAVASQLEARGERTVCMPRQPRFADGGSVQDFRQLLAQCESGPPLRGILHLWALDAADPTQHTADQLMVDGVALAHSAVTLVQALAAHPQPPLALWLITRGVQPAGDAGTPPIITPALLCGIGKTIAREYPAVWGGLVDLDAADGDDAARIVAEATCGDGEDLVAFRRGQRWVARLLPCDPMPIPAPAVQPAATYLITGGHGALGLESARWLVEGGARHLMLVSRGAASAHARDAIAALQAQGVEVKVCQADVADEVAMAKIIAAIQADGPQLRGVIHAAGLPGRLDLAEMDRAALARIGAAKVAGTWVLHRLTRDIDLDFFVLFSSMVSLWGAREQGHYAAANHFLDVFTHYRRALGLPAVCVNWGPLSGGGMLPPDDLVGLRRIGVSATPLDQAGAALTRLVGSPLSHAAVVKIEWPLFRSAYQSRGPCRMFDLLTPSVSAEPALVASSRASDTRHALPERLRNAPIAERWSMLLAHLQSTLGQVLGLADGVPVDGQQGLFDMGMDSLTAMEFRTRLQASLAISLPATLTFDYGTLDALADFLMREAFDPKPYSPATEPRKAEDRQADMLALVERISDDEVGALLEARLLTL